LVFANQPRFSELSFIHINMSLSMSTGMGVAIWALLVRGEHSQSLLLYIVQA